jgi:hypothetical protein
VAALAHHGDVQRVGGGEDGAFARDEAAVGVECGRHVEGVRRHRQLAAGQEQPFVDHRLRSAGALLRGLEHEDDRPRQLIAYAGEQVSGAGQEGDVHVVAAGVHDAVDLRRVVQPGQLLHGQRIHIAPQQHGRSGPAAAQDGDDGAERLAGRDFQR